MDNERVRDFCLDLPHVSETVNWGHHLVYRVGDRAIGGKMFAMTDLDGTGIGVLWFHCGVERFHELLEIDGVVVSPYLARAHWVTLEHWNALPPRQIKDELRCAHALVYEKLPQRTKALLGAGTADRKTVNPEQKTGRPVRKPETGNRRTR